MRPAIHLFASLAMTAAAVGCAFMLPLQAAAAGVTVVDDTPQAAAGSPRSVGAFSRLRIEGSIDVEAHPGTHPGVTVHASKRIEPLIETFVDGDTLVVRMKHGVDVITFGHDDTRVDVEFTQLAATHQSGSGDLHVRGLSAPRLDASISGSGDLRLENAQVGSLALRIDGSGDVMVDGRADDAKFSIDGSGDISAEHLAARRVEVAIRGSGDASVNASEALDARVAGSGDIVYRGHPQKISRDIAGSGSVSADD
jgi:hypothetical protein